MACTIGAIVLLGGCARTYEMTVDSVADHLRTGSGYSYWVLAPVDPRVEQTDLRWMEAVEFVKTALSGRGMYEAPAIDRADMLIEIDYGMEPPRTIIKTKRVAVHTMVPVYTMRERGRMTVRRKTETNYKDEIESIAIYEKYLRITALANQVELDTDNPHAQIWSVLAITEDESNDLRAYVPLMASAVMDYIELNSGDPREVKIRDRSPDVLFVRAGM